MGPTRLSSGRRSGPAEMARLPDQTGTRVRPVPVARPEARPEAVTTSCDMRVGHSMPGSAVRPQRMGDLRAGTPVVAGDDPLSIIEERMPRELSSHHGELGTSSRWLLGGWGHLVSARRVQTTRFSPEPMFSPALLNPLLVVEPGGLATLRRAEQTLLSPLPPQRDARICAGHMRATRRAWAEEKRATAGRLEGAWPGTGRTAVK
jgi:hypothetical protein